jgi:hypothetical protein
MAIAWTNGLSWSVFWIALSAFTILYLIRRMLRTGVFVSHAGIRVRWTWRTQTVPWEHLAQVGATLTPFGYAITLVTTFGDQITAPIYRGWIGDRYNAALRPKTFDRLLLRLQALHASAAQPPGPHRGR